MTASTLSSGIRLNGTEQWPALTSTAMLVEEAEGATVWIAELDKLNNYNPNQSGKLGGFGVNVRIMRMTIPQGYFAGGRGGGLHPDFNLAK
jgi:hypothetical protein